jgi:DnaJ-class molecular chaperone
VVGDPAVARDLADDRLPASEPLTCLRCGGRGVTEGPDSFGNYDGCDRCEGTGIDPTDPRCPL